MITSSVNIGDQKISFKFNDITEGLVRFAKTLTNRHGHNQQGAALPQDQLILCEGYLHGWCGVAITFAWASGRQDWHNMVDVEGVVDVSLGDLRKAVWDSLPCKEEIPFYFQEQREVEYEYR